MGEFDLIRLYFSRHKHLKRADILQSVGDDCAVLNVPNGRRLAVTTDTLVCGTHFLPDISPSDLAYKSLAVNLSDLAGMGAKPAWISLALTLPSIDEAWLSAFSETLFNELERFDVALIGGDTTKGSLSLTLTAQGFLPQDRGLYRHQAQVGDLIFVSGTLGDSSAGLDLLLKAENKLTEAQQQLLKRHLRPTPRIELGEALTAYSRCALDISDGLLADLRHILTASRCGADIWVEQLPLSPALCEVYPLEQAEAFALGGGEDYELCFTVPPQNAQAVTQLSERLNISCRCIGEITAKQEELRLFKHEQPYRLPTRFGFDHFTL